MARGKSKIAIGFILIARAIVVGVAYYLVRYIPDLPSSFVAVFAGFLAFDVIVAMPKFSLRPKHWVQMVVVLLPRLSATAGPNCGPCPWCPLWRSDEGGGAGGGGAVLCLGLAYRGRAD